MEKTTIGISKKMLACAVFLTAYFSGYIALFLLGGYILLREKEESQYWLKLQTVKAAILMFAFSLLGALIGVIPKLFTWLGDIVAMFKGYLHPSFIYDAQAFLADTLAIVEMVIFLLLAIFALFGKNMKIIGVDNLTYKMLGYNPPAPPVQPAAQQSYPNYGGPGYETPGNGTYSQQQGYGSGQPQTPAPAQYPQGMNQQQ